MAIQGKYFTLRVNRAGAVTAADIQGQSGVRILDPSHHLFTLQEKRDVDLELHVNKGRGFVLADQHTLPRGAPVDLVRIDAIYNPVRRANFTVEETRVGQRTDFDRLTLTVDEIRAECETLARHGFQTVLLLTGDAPQAAPVDYLAQAVAIAREYFSSVSVEVYALGEDRTTGGWWTKGWRA